MSKISFEGFNARYLTFSVAKGSGLKAGDFVTLTGDGTVAPVTAPASINGICTLVRGDYATVQISGYISLDTEPGDNITLGYCPVGAGAGNTLNRLEGARQVFVTELSENSIGFIL